MKKNKKLLILRVSLGFVVGMSLGYMLAMDACIDLGIKILNIELDPVFYQEVKFRFPEIIQYIKQT